MKVVTYEGRYYLVCAMRRFTENLYTCTAYKQPKGATRRMRVHNEVRNTQKLDILARIALGIN